jgi:hypothetical protein
VLSEKQDTAVCALSGRFVPPPKGEGNSTPEPFAPVQTVHRAMQQYRTRHNTWPPPVKTPLSAGCTGSRPSKNCHTAKQWTSLVPEHSCGPSTTTAVQDMARVYAYGVPGLPNWQDTSPHFQL